VDSISLWQGKPECPSSVHRTFITRCIACPRTQNRRRDETLQIIIIIYNLVRSYPAAGREYIRNEIRRCCAYTNCFPGARERYIDIYHERQYTVANAPQESRTMQLERRFSSATVRRRGETDRRLDIIQFRSLVIVSSRRI